MRIVFEHLSFSYNKKSKLAVDAVKDVSLVIEEGEFFGIIGQTGSGKSTLIQHLNALIPVQEGRLTVGDFDLSVVDKAYKKRLKELRGKVGMVFQYPEYQLFAETVYDDVAFGLKNFFPDMPQEVRARKVASALAAVGLNFSEIAKKSPFDLSGGQKRRVAIAGVLVTDPEVLVLDEPVAGLDPAGKKELMALLKSLMQGNRTIVVVSHDMDEVCENCSKIAVMSEGKLVAVGTPEKIFRGDIQSLRLALPVTAYLKEGLAQCGVKIEGGLKTDEFIGSVAMAYAARVKKDNPR